MDNSQNEHIPELGNLCFGNSRGNYVLERGIGFEEELFRLFNAYASDRDNSWREYGVQFENDTFFVFPYYWGDCTCGYAEADNFNEKHANECYHTKKKKIEKEWAIKKGELKEFEKFEYFSEYGLPENERKIYNKEIEELCKSMGLSYPHGCAVHCNCDYWERYYNYLNKIGYPNGCKKECLLMRPNFYYKPNGFEIQWYKYPLRDSYTNKPITLTEFKQIIDKCIESINNEN